MCPSIGLFELTATTGEIKLPGIVTLPPILLLILILTTLIKNVLSIAYLNASELG